MTKPLLSALALLCSLLLGCDSNPSPQAYPHKTVKIICPWAAGGGTDQLSRFMADQLDKALGNPFVVANMTSGAGAEGHGAGASARPDGYTLTMATFELSTMHWMGVSPLTYLDFQPALQLNADAAAIIVRADAPWNTLNEFLDHVRANPAQIRMSGTATGGAWDLARAGLMLAANLPVNAITWSPERGSAPSIVKLLGGHIEAVCCSIPEAATQVEAGELKVLAIMSSSRHPQFPNVPTAREAGVDWEAVGWRGLMLPKGTPDEVLDVIVQECLKIVESEDFKNFMQKRGFAIQVRERAEFTAFLKAQDAQWQTVIEAAGYARK